jgi:hypothetical protein
MDYTALYYASYGLTIASIILASSTSLFDEDGRLGDAPRLWGSITVLYLAVFEALQLFHGVSIWNFRGSIGLPWITAVAIWGIKYFFAHYGAERRA